jgi:hypothetical protein
VEVHTNRICGNDEIWERLAALVENHREVFQG